MDKLDLMTTISLVRHGLVHNPKGILYGRLPRFGLSEAGRQQAQRAAIYLESQPPAAVYSSPMLRAKQTADIILQYHPHLKLQQSALLNEVYTPYEGQPLRELETRNWDLYEDIAPPYEMPADIFQRAYQFMEKIRDQYHGKHVVAVTHGDIVAFLMIWARGLPVSGDSKRELFLETRLQEYPATGSVTTFTYRTTRDEDRPNYLYRGL